MDLKTHTLPELRECYLAYTPPFDVAALVRELLGYVPAEYLRGLKYVALRNASGLSRRDRRHRIPSRGKRVLTGGCLGLFYRQSSTVPAHIVIHVDRLIEQAPRLALRVSIYRDSLFARTLYHEIGHHIHRL